MAEAQDLVAIDLAEIGDIVRRRLLEVLGSERVRRCGCWADHGWPCRSAFRVRFEPERRSNHIGFRVVAVQRR